MSKITTGGSFGINAKQARVLKMIADGEDMDTILMIEYNLDPRLPENKNKAKSIKCQITKWSRDPKCMECYRALIREKAMFGVAKANRVLEKTMDSGNEWAAMQASNSYLSRYGDMVMGEDTRETVIRIEGMPTLGTPNGEGDAE